MTMVNQSLPTDNVTHVPDHDDHHGRIYITVTSNLILSLAVSGVVGNIMLITAHFKDPLKVLNTSWSPFVINIACVDIILSISFIYMSLIALTTGKMLVKNVPNTLGLTFFLIYFPSFLSLAVERNLSISKPLWHRLYITKRWRLYWICAIWMITIVFYLGIEPAVKLNPLASPNSLFFGVFIWDTTLLVVTQITYLLIYLTLVKKRKDLQRQQLNATDRIRHEKMLKNEHNFLVTIFIVCMILVLTMAPTLLHHLISGKVWVDFNEQYATDPPILKAVYSIRFVLLATGNSCINLVVYIMRLGIYRKTFKKLFCGSNGQEN